ncbi:hypothetical protein BABINDRAFT_15064 [Babjeviella inositovora NRRL Y-12698]|uniref:DNA ligase n=1 Tax=Babjeviella inositovora NRRL Y-12698 TaxID=984486 RepID=A0A1E3QK87_9ASCO|nr:uncharacterized protein BABINDRAFT_15064 [Babjeviella inositovora NRRL Y-12698]ODQ78095.1 hypothetical protein BABINDRAFT_15064 [Babjeviella inositovora NRRL Y-12698]
MFMRATTRNKFTNSLFTTTFAIAFTLVGLNSVIPCPIDQKNMANDSVSPSEVAAKKQGPVVSAFSDIKDVYSSKEATEIEVKEVKEVFQKQVIADPEDATTKVQETPKRILAEATESLSKKVKTDEELPATQVIEADVTTVETSVETKALTEADVPTSSKALAAGPIPYAALCKVFEKIEDESGRLKITAYCTEFFLEVLQSNPSKLVQITYLFINRLGPDYEPGLELGLGETLLIKAIGENYGRPAAKIKADFHETGDLGIVAEQSRASQPTMFKPKPLDVDTVFKQLTAIARSTGKNSQGAKISIIGKMLTACSGTEARFLIRSLEGKLRIGLAEKTVLNALAASFVQYEAARDAKKQSPRQMEELLAKAEDMIKDAFCQVPNYEIVITNALQYGIFSLSKHCTLKPGVPLKPMLAKPTKSITEVLDRFQGEEFTCEYKYDGERAQVHLLDSGEVKVYSRNSEDMSQRYPDIIDAVKHFLKPDVCTTSLILDCEAVAWDREAQKILPFQVLSTRKRKDVEERDIKVHICLFAFDMLCLNGEPLIMKSLAERRGLMESVLSPVEGKFQYATTMNTSSIEEIQVFLDKSVSSACEGLMVKMLNGSESGYEPSKRSRNWLKLKKDYLAGVGDSLDLVVVGAYIGKGKRTGSYGGFLLATYNPDTSEYETTCKIGTGFSDEDLAALYLKLFPTVISQPKSYYVYDTTNGNAKPDVWFEPTTVFEVLTADLSLSPIYKAGHNVMGRGISLRFPRMLRVRDDKGTEDATSSDQIIEMYERQASLN